MKAASTPLAGTERPVALMQVGMAALVGLLVAPALLGPEGPSSAYSAGGLDPRLALWLAVACLIAIWLLVLAPRMAQATARLLARALPDDPTLLDASSAFLRVLARWLVALGYVVLSTTILRPPLVSVLSSFLDPLAVASAVAGVVALLIILVLVRLHVAATPAVETYAWHALDALVSTSGPLPAGRSERVSRTRWSSGARAEVQRRATPSAATEPPSPTVAPDAGATEGSAGATEPSLAEATGTIVSGRGPAVTPSPGRIVAGPATEVDGQPSSWERTQPEVAAASDAETSTEAAPALDEGATVGEATVQGNIFRPHVGPTTPPVRPPMIAGPTSSYPSRLRPKES